MGADNTYIRTIQSPKFSLALFPLTPKTTSRPPRRPQPFRKVEIYATVKK